MGACYSVTLAVKTKQPDELVKYLNEQADADEATGRISYRRDEFHNTETLQDYFKCLLAEDQDNGYEESAEDNWFTASSCFDARYGWAQVLEDNFRRMLNFCEKGELHVYMFEDGKYDLYISNGKIITSKPAWLKKGEY